MWNVRAKLDGVSLHRTTYKLIKLHSGGDHSSTLVVYEAQRSHPAPAHVPINENDRKVSLVLPLLVSLSVLVPWQHEPLLSGCSLLSELESPYLHKPKLILDFASISPDIVFYHPPFYL